MSGLYSSVQDDIYVWAQESPYELIPYWFWNSSYVGLIDDGPLLSIHKEDVNINVYVHLYNAVWLHAENHMLITPGREDGKWKGGGVTSGGRREDGKGDEGDRIRGGR